MTPEAQAALRALLAEVARAQVLLSQRPEADVLAVTREASHAQHALQLVAEFLCRDTEPARQP